MSNTMPNPVHSYNFYEHRKLVLDRINRAIAEDSKSRKKTK